MAGLWLVWVAGRDEFCGCAEKGLTKVGNKGTFNRQTDRDRGDYRILRY